MLAENVEYFYFFSNNSPSDVAHYRQMQVHGNFNVVSFNTSHHGIPFLKVALGSVLELEPKQLKQLCSKKHNPVLFTIHQVGLLKTIKGFGEQMLAKYRRRK